MENTSKQIAITITDLLVAHGIKRIVVSPGSRNAPIIVALSKEKRLECVTIVDERSAAFIALGMAEESTQPIALCCTSGTALLNYAPAVAEAWYRSVPLIVISADRPEEWIDQDDSQTLRQNEALREWVKREWTLSESDSEWMINRCVNDALISANACPQGPVHLNVRLDAPLGKMESQVTRRDERIVTSVIGDELSSEQIKGLREKLVAKKKILVIAGFMQPDHRVNRALIRFASSPCVTVLTENVANLHSPDFIGKIDATLVGLKGKAQTDLIPDLVITIGGALISRHLKEWLRSLPESIEHWSVSQRNTTVDCFKHLSMRVQVSPLEFFRKIGVPKGTSTYRETWLSLAKNSNIRDNLYLKTLAFSDMTAMAAIIKSIPRDWNVQFSNGTVIRYAQLMDCRHLHRCDCNRGVSGIDGSVSTAIGASHTYKGFTVLVTGDMSAQYDIGALGSPLLTNRFRMIVLNNKGGGIFRFVESTRNLAERERFFGEGPMNFPIKAIAKAYGWEVEEANEMETLQLRLSTFFKPSRCSRILVVNTPTELSAEILRNYFEQET